MIIIALASTWFAPFLHMIWSKGRDEGMRGFAVTHTAVMVLLDVLALFFYTTHIPEIWWSHTFDLWVSGLSCFPTIFNSKLTTAVRGLQGASHQIFHLLIDVGQLVCLLGLRKVMLRHNLLADGSVAAQISNETSLSS